ncbi:MAG: fluoride efflux transporter CrcB [Saprospiraceae bacterium]|nr:fluoride efflux transporter CrcB [Saprospiraceae bacterium]
MQSALAVFLGGGLGSLSRFLVGKIFEDNTSWFFFGTFSSNMLSSFILGYLVTLAASKSISEEWQLLLMVGFCGGFSTFSTFSLENYNLIQSGNTSGALIYTALSLLLGVLCIYLGIRIGNS